VGKLNRLLIWKGRVIVAITGIIFISFFKIARKENYCFRGVTLGTLGRTYTQSFLTIENDSLFTLNENLSRTKGNLKKGVFYNTSELNGFLKRNADTLRMFFTSPEKETNYVFLVEKNGDISLLDYAGRKIQRWKKCSSL
jgi:hypothetical protein